MHHMNRATVRDLRYRFPMIEDLLNQGEPIEITKRKRTIARLLPVRPEATKVPDFLKRLRKMYGNRKMKVSSAELLQQERDRF